MSVKKRQRAMLERMFREQFAPKIAGADRGAALHALLTAFSDVRVNAISGEEFTRRARTALQRYLPLEPRP